MLPSHIQNNNCVCDGKDKATTTIALVIQEHHQHPYPHQRDSIECSDISSSLLESAYVVYVIRSWHPSCLSTAETPAT